ncbi:MAG: diaminopimelate dehydrogenase [Dehalococcoidia bacterium]|jgi:diaminopimelate dehydrogenase
MEVINVAIVGYGNVGRGVIAALDKSDDMKLSAAFSRRPEQVAKQLKGVAVLNTDKFALSKGVKIDVAILCGGSKEDIPAQGPVFAKHFSTIDSFDTHADIPRYFKKMDAIARKGGNVSIISAGWDPGIFSIERVLGDAFLPGGRGFTFWGPGVSQGHSDAARKIEGVLDARQYTLPIETALEKVRSGKTPEFTKGQMHKRLVYIVAKKGADRERIRREIVEMPNYYSDYHTKVVFISEKEMTEKHSAYPHGGFVLNSGVVGKNSRQILEYSCKLESNPGFTGSVLVACARAAYRLKQQGRSGAFTMLDIPPALYSPHSANDLRGNFV